MERLSSGAPVPAHLRGSIMALGNFDGFHAGHQAVVGRAIARARAEGRPAIVATFDPHPMRLFQPDAPSFRLTTLDQREALFAQAGADAMLVFDFTTALAALDPAAYVRLLTDQLGVGAVITGEDFTFGRARSGSVGSFAQLGLPSEAVAAVSDGAGVVQHGDKLGRTIGFPTANIDMGPYLRPAYGIYAVRGRLADGRVLDGAANLGIRPSFDPPKELLEPHFFDFAESLYGSRIEVQLIRYLHGEVKYDSLDALMAGIAKDCVDARQILAGTARLA
jgi:riboflavin kinase/FMN adenylyltransferase